MKNVFLALGCLLSVFFIGCKKDDASVTPNLSTEVSNTLKNGTWRVSYYWDNDQDETGSFNGYTFLFLNNNTVTASNNNNTVSGSWTMGTDDSAVKIFLNFVSPPDFESISGDWKISLHSPTQVNLVDSSGGNGTVDYLRFVRN
jgi:hypothetical protein